MAVRHRNKAATREEILSAARTVLNRDGSGRLSTRSVAAEAGVNQSLIHYHFGTRDDLVSAITTESGRRAAHAIEAVPPARTVRSGIKRLWEAYRSPALAPLLTLYCQAAATGLIGREPYRTDVRASNALWTAALKDYLIRCGADPQRAGRVVTLVDSALYGFFLDLVTDRPEELERGVADLADAAQGLANA